jgi:hypothetical protein
MMVEGLNVLFAIWTNKTLAKVTAGTTVWVATGTVAFPTGAVTFATMPVSAGATVVASVVGAAVVAAGVATTVATAVGTVVVAGGVFACWVHPLTATRTMIKIRSPIIFFIISKLISPDN